MSWTEWTHVAFFAAGIVCLFILPVTVNNWLAYAEEGYGIEVKMGVVGYTQNSGGNNMRLTFQMTNPGSFDVEIVNGTFTFTDSAGQRHSAHWMPPYSQRPLVLTRDLESIVVTSFTLPDEDYAALNSGGWTLDARFILYIEERDAWVPLDFHYNNGVGGDR